MRHPHAIVLTALSIVVAALGLWDGADITDDVSGSAVALLGYMAWIVGSVLVGRAAADDMHNGYLARVRLSDVSAGTYLGCGVTVGTVVSIAILLPALIVTMVFQILDPRGLPWSPLDLAISGLALAVMAGSGAVVGSGLGLAGVPAHQTPPASIAVLVVVSFLGQLPHNALNFTHADPSVLVWPATTLVASSIGVISSLTTRWGRART